MNAMWIFGTSALLAVGLAALVVAWLKAPLHVLLTELCGSSSRARFWVVHAGLSTVLISLFGVLLSLPPESSWSDAAWREMLVGLRTGILGLLLSLASMAFVLMISIYGYERDRRAAAAPSADPGWWMKPRPTPPRS